MTNEETRRQLGTKLSPPEKSIRGTSVIYSDVVPPAAANHRCDSLAGDAARRREVARHSKLRLLRHRVNPLIVEDEGRNDGLK